VTELDGLIDKMSPAEAARFCSRLSANPAAAAAVREALRARPTVAAKIPPLALLAAAEKDPAGWRPFFPQLRSALNGADALRFFKLEVAERDPDGARSIASRCARGGPLYASRSVVIGEALAAEWTDAYPDLAALLANREVKLASISAPREKVRRFVETRPELFGRWLAEALAGADEEARRIAVKAIESDSDEKSRAALAVALAGAPPAEVSRQLAFAVGRREAAWQRLACDVLARERRPLEAATVLAAASDPASLAPETRAALVRTFHGTPTGAEWTLRAVLGEAAYKDVKRRRDEATKLAAASAALKKLASERVFTFRAGGEVVGRYLATKTTNPIIVEVEAALKAWPARDRTALGVQMQLLADNAQAAEKSARGAFVAGCKSLGVSLDSGFFDRTAGLSRTGRAGRAVQIYCLDLDHVLRESRFGRIELDDDSLAKWERFKKLFADP
jgi:hypothetical protein